MAMKVYSTRSRIPSFFFTDVEALDTEYIQHILNPVDSKENLFGLVWFGLVWLGFMAHQPLLVIHSKSILKYIDSSISKNSVKRKYSFNVKNSSISNNSV